MKFILNESKKFLLEERFILTEDQSPEVATTRKWLQLWATDTRDGAEIRDKLTKWVEACTTGALKAPTVTSTSFDKLEVEEKKVEAAIKAPIEGQSEGTQKKELGEIKKCLDTYIDTLEDIVSNNQKKVGKTFDKTVSTLKTLNKQLADISSSSSSQSKNITKVLPQVLQLSKALPQVVETLKKLLDTTAQNDAADKLKQFEEQCKACKNLIFSDGIVQMYVPKATGDDYKNEVDINAADGTVKVKINLRDVTKAHPKGDVYLNNKLNAFPDSTLKSCQGLISTALKAMKDLDSYNESKVQQIKANIDTYSAQIKLIIDSTQKLLKSAIFADINEVAKKDKQQSDWKTMLAGAKDKEKVIESFIYKTWPKQAEEVLKIKKTLLLECEAYGFDTNNPFLQFISDIYLKYPVSLKAYNVVHNLSARGYLKADDIRGAGPMGKANIIFCPNLYTMAEGAMKLYIEKQFNLLKTTNIKGPEDKNKPSSAANLAYNALYNLEPPNYKIDPLKIDSVANKTLRPMNEVETIEQTWTGSISGTVLDNEKNKVKSNNDVVNKLKDAPDLEQEATLLLAVLKVKFSSNTEIQTKAGSVSAVNALLSSRTAQDFQAQMKKTEQKYGISGITAKQALDLVKTILDDSDIPTKV
jgi:hypothetical protein